MQLDFLAQLMPRERHGIPHVPSDGSNRSHAIDGAILEEKARSLLRARGVAGLAERLRVRWNKRMRSTAGAAFFEKVLITLNPRLRDFGVEEIERTLRHELAHLLAQHRAGRRRITPHGREWQAACAELGLEDEKRCHDLPLPSRTLPRRHRYRCPRCGLELRRVKPLRSRTACLACCRSHARGQYDERFRFVKLRS
jgi:SprT protein